MDLKGFKHNNRQWYKNVLANNIERPIQLVAKDVSKVLVTYTSGG